LLVTGASQGATSVNRFVTALAESDPGAFETWQILHLTGRGADAPVRELYARHGIAARVEEFLEEIGLAWGAADLAVSRGGASSVAEAAANTVPTLFLPYPYHRDAHQRGNAQPLVDLGGAVLADDLIDARANVASVGPILTALMGDDERRQAMRAALIEHRPPDAAEAIAELLLNRGPS
jgi:UDP-N-acetylglucosamine:LPS N-acetylglucosamine transferase